MSRSDIDINFMAQETLNLCFDFQSSKHFDGDDLNTFSTSESDHFFDEEKESCLDSSGVVYYLDKGISTFCIRGFPSYNLAWEKEAITEREPQVIKKLKISEEFLSTDIGFFPTENFEVAEVISEQLINRRFPKNEASLCNISDPGFSWWGNFNNNSIEIFFQSHGIERDLSLVQLGPLGDPLTTYKWLNQSMNILKKLFSINEFSATEKKFTIVASRSNDSFYDFQKVFTEGKFNLDFSKVELSSQEKLFLLFLKEVSFLRSFWIDIVQKL